MVCKAIISGDVLIESIHEYLDDVQQEKSS